MDPAEFSRHRDAYMAAIGDRSVAIVHASPERPRSGDTHHPYRPSSDLYYLTGFVEPEATLVLRPGASSERVVLFVRPRDPEKEIWDGRRAGVDGALSDFGADAAYPAQELRQRLPALLANVEDLYVELGTDGDFDATLMSVIRELRRSERRKRRPPQRLIDPRFSLHEMRLRKTPAELDVMRRAAAITDEAHRDAMRLAGDGVGEHELAAAIDYAFRKSGGTGPGYESIIGSGDNATILHYTENNRTMRAGELVLIDAGCELGYYTADVTRTFPVSGTFTSVQRKAYEIVLRAQLEAIEMTRPGATIDGIHERTVEVLTEGMIELGLLQGSVAERIADESYMRFYMHRTSHWLGLDVHDVGAYTAGGEPRPLEPGMVITIEPGLYVAADTEGAPDGLRGLGIRIEDDILIRDGGCENLTSAVPKTVAEVEAACQITS